MIRKKDNGANEVLRKYRVGIDGIKTGFVGGKAESRHADSNLTNAEIAAIHEFGLGHQEATHFLADSFDDHFNENKRLLKKLLQKWLQGRISEKQVRRLFGEEVINQIRRKITAVGLVDTGELRDAVDWEED